jgi:hypothetical protein
MNIIKSLKRKILKYRSNKKAFNIGYRAGKGYNIYLTFGSVKTITKDAVDSYKRYKMAMKHYKQKPCLQKAFTRGYNKAIQQNNK